MTPPPGDPRDRVHQFADQLRQYATHFAPRDWNYTRDVGDLRMFHVREVRRGARQAFKYATRGVDDIGLGETPSRWGMVRAALRGIRSHPDGVLDNGGIVTHWEETGEYLQYVQPSVGALLADLMDAHPDLPEVQAIADEMKRINDAYGERVAAGEVD